MPTSAPPPSDPHTRAFVAALVDAVAEGVLRDIEAGLITLSGPQRPQTSNEKQAARDAAEGSP